MNRLAILAVAAALIAAGAQAQQMKPENQLKLRKSTYAVMGYAFGSLADMAEGKRPYSRDEALRHAELVARLATLPKGFFGEGTDKVGETRAKPEIWTKRSDFDAKMEKMIEETRKLPAAAASGDVATLHKAVTAADDACTACHDEYRTKRR